MKTHLSAAVLLLLAACGQNTVPDKSDATAAANLTSKPDENDPAANTEVVMNGTAVSTPVTAPEFVNMAAASDQFEIQSSQLAKAKASGAATKSFADMMIAEHTKSSEQLAAAARGATPALTPAPSLSAEQRANLDALKAAPAGPAFDKQSATFQVAGHQNTLALLRGYSVRGDQPMLKMFASKAAPMVQRHLEQAQGLAK